MRALLNILWILNVYGYVERGKPGRQRHTMQYSPLSLVGVVLVVTLKKSARLSTAILYGSRLTKMKVVFLSIADQDKETDDVGNGCRQIDKSQRDGLPLLI